MRLLLPLFAIIGLLVSPVAASAAQAKCNHRSMAAGMDRATSLKSDADPCCDKTGHKRADGKACAQICALAGGVTAALPVSPANVMLASVPASKVPATAISEHPYQPSGPEPPPKSLV